MSLQSVRVDIWLDVACLFRSRSEAQRATNGGKVAINGSRARPNREVRTGDEIRITRSPGVKQVVQVFALADRHLPKKDARALYKDRTPQPTAEEAEFRMLLKRAGRSTQAQTAPDKRQRRKLRQLKGRE